MNPIIRLILALALGLTWYGFSRAYGPQSKISKEDPAGNLRRLDISSALRAMAFFCLVWFIASTVVIFVFSLVLALVVPPDNHDFVTAFGDVLNSATGNTGLLQPLSLAGGLSTLAATVVTVWFTQRVARNQSLFDLGLRPYRALPLDLILGLILGPLLFAFIFQLETIFGYLKVSPGPNYDWPSLLGTLVAFSCVAISEELVVRGFFLQTINQIWGGLAAIITTSVFWGFAHLFNPRADLLAVFNIVIAGLIFAYAYNITGHLWLPIAMHLSWNFAEGAIFGFPVSGYTVDKPIYQATPDGPSQITGGRFGPEGGLVSLFALVVAGLILYGWNLSRPPSSVKKP